jgi:NAD+ kinase
MGSLGFLCPFDFENYRGYVNGVLKGGVPLLLRNRLKCKLERSLDISEKSEDSNANSSMIHVFNSSRFIDSSYVNEDDLKEPQQEWLSLNEIVISRGPSPFLSNLDLYLNDYLVTTVQGDGLIISTPTGTFYFIFY